jgi:multidrug efflux system outer membrane protein
LFTGGKISGQVKVAEAVKRELLLTYVSTIRNAFKETEDAFTDRVYTQEQLMYQGKRVESLILYKQLADMRYKEGVTSYLEVLDAERSLFSSQLDYVATQAFLLKSVVNIYRTLAGSWVDRLSEKTIK